MSTGGSTEAQLCIALCYTAIRVTASISWELKLNNLCVVFWHAMRCSVLAIQDRIIIRVPVGARFSAPVQTGPWAHPASYSVGTGSFPEVKRPGRGVNPTPPSSIEVKDRVELYLYSPSEPSQSVLGRTLLGSQIFFLPVDFKLCVAQCVLVYQCVSLFAREFVRKAA